MANSDKQLDEGSSKRKKNLLSRLPNPLKGVTKLFRISRSEQTNLYSALKSTDTNQSDHYLETPTPSDSSKSDHYNQIPSPDNANQIYKKKANEPLSVESQTSLFDQHWDVTPTENQKQKALENMLNNREPSFLKAVSESTSTVEGKSPPVKKAFGKINELIIDAISYIPNEAPKNKAFTKTDMEIEAEREQFAIKIQSLHNALHDLAEQTEQSDPALCQVCQQYARFIYGEFNDELTREIKKSNTSAPYSDIEQPEDHYQEGPSASSFILEARKNLVKDAIGTEQIQSTRQLPINARAMYECMTNLATACEHKNEQLKQGKTTSAEKQNLRIKELVTELHILNILAKQEKGVYEKNTIDNLIDQQFAELSVQTDPRVSEKAQQKKDTLAVNQMLGEFNNRVDGKAPNAPVKGVGNSKKILDYAILQKVETLVKNCLKNDGPDLQAIHAVLNSFLKNIERDLLLASKGIIRTDALSDLNYNKELFDSMGGMNHVLNSCSKSALEFVQHMLKESDKQLLNTQKTATQSQDQVQSVSQLRTSAHEDKPKEPSTRMKSK